MSDVSGVSDVICEVASARHAAALVALFDRAGSPCFCRFWHFEGSNNEWLDRCANAKDENRAELEAGLARGSDDARGIVAIDGDRVIGWLKVAPAKVMTKAFARRLYKGLPCFEGDREHVFVIGCALVDPEHRKRGVAVAMVGEAVHLAPAWGARALEAFPRVPAEAVHDDELWTGPLSAFTKNGFVAVSAFAPYPVMRLDFTTR